MAIAYYMDVHFPEPITRQLRKRDVDVLTVIADGRRESPDHELLYRARDLGRVVVTMDRGFRLLAEQWQREGRRLSGLIYARGGSATVGQFVHDSELIAKASDPDDMANVVQQIPL